MHILTFYLFLSGSQNILWDQWSRGRYVFHPCLFPDYPLEQYIDFCFLYILKIPVKTAISCIWNVTSFAIQYAEMDANPAWRTGSVQAGQTAAQIPYLKPWTKYLVKMYARNKHYRSKDSTTKEVYINGKGKNDSEITKSHNKLVSIIVLGPVNVYPNIFENAYIFIRFGLAFTRRRASSVTENEAFRKRCPKCIFLKTPFSPSRVVV